MTTENILCPCCGADETTPWATENGFTAVQCNLCRLVYVNPRPRADSIDESNKIGVHAGEKPVNVKARRMRAKIGHYQGVIENFFAPEIASGKALTWLDVGAGYGEVVEAATLALPGGSAVEGVEPMLPKAEAARARGLNVSSGPLEEFGGYDVVSLINVFSHIPDFHAFGATLVSKIKPGGSLFLETGNGADLSSRSEYRDILYLPDHLVFAGETQLRRMLTDLGLTVVQFEQRPVGGWLWRFSAARYALKSGSLRFPSPERSQMRALLVRAVKA